MNNHENERGVKYRFFLSHESTNLPESASIDSKIEFVAITNIRSVDEFASKKLVERFPDKEPWIRNKNKNLVTKRNNSFQKLLENLSTENHCAYKEIRIEINHLIRIEKKQANTFCNA